MPSAKPSAAEPTCNAHGPLQGLRVLDLSSMIAGPYAAQILADYGADVIKVEPPDGDPMRRTIGSAKSPDMSPLYLQINRNKRSLALDLKQAAARESLLRLCAKADVVSHNIRPAPMRRLGLSYDDLRKVNPRIVHVGIMGYGESGPYAGKPAYDDLIQGACGLPSVITWLDGREPRYVPLAMVDRIVGLNAAHAVLAAIIGRDRTGQGQNVELPMFETMAQFVLGDHLGGRSFEPPNGEIGYRRLALRRPYKTSDGYVCALIFTDKQWRSLFEGRGRMDQYESMPHLTKYATRRLHYEEMQKVIADIFGVLSTADSLALLHRCDIPCSPLNTIDSLIDDPHLAAVNFFHVKPHPTEGVIRYAGIPSRWNGNALPIARHAPRIGEHSVAVLQEAGLTTGEIGALLRTGAAIDGELKTEAALAH